MNVTIRPLREEDVDAVREVQVEAFSALDRALGGVVWEITPAVVERQRGRLRHFLTHDPDGSWVAEVDGRVAGAALALRRESLWGLSLLVVLPACQSQGLGRALLDASLTYAKGTDRAVILSSQDARAMRRYASAGFALFPQVSASGPLDPTRLRAPARPVRPGGTADTAFADGVDVAVRGAARGPDHGVMLTTATMYVTEGVGTGGRGYAYVRPDGRILTVTATDDEAATALLWQCLAHPADNDERTIDHINSEQQWAVQVALAAGLRFAPAGPVFWRGACPPRSYLPDGAYL